MQLLPLTIDWFKEYMKHDFKSEGNTQYSVSNFRNVFD